MVQEAYLGSFLRTALIIGLAFYSIRFITRLLTKKSSTSSRNDLGGNKSKGQEKDNDLGEYVDFEEVDD